MSKKTKSEMSITLIVTAVICLVILVVVMFIWGKQSGETTKILSSCDSRGGEYIASFV